MSLLLKAFWWLAISLRGRSQILAVISRAALWHLRTPVPALSLPSFTPSTLTWWESSEIASTFLMLGCPQSLLHLVFSVLISPVLDICMVSFFTCSSSSKLSPSQWDTHWSLYLCPSFLTPQFNQGRRNNKNFIFYFCQDSRQQTEWLQRVVGKKEEAAKVQTTPEDHIAIRSTALG